MYNTDIDISEFKKIDKLIIDEIDKEFYKKYISIPNEFNWSKKLPSDSEEITNKKSLISEVKNQFLCGCCWAISCATAISDAFVITELVNWKPNVSYTYALSHYPQQKCVGGSSRILLEDIKNGHGIASDSCVDESWCLNNSRCWTNDSSEHFRTQNKEYLSSLIPPEGCYDGNKKHYIFKIDDVYSMTVSEDLKIFETQMRIKQHIMIRGPVVGGFLILENFPNGKFCKINKGIYFEKCDYNNDPITFNYSKDKIIGSHAVVIMGWGVEKNVQFKDVITSIPYWYCRNSWGTHWGDSGYFKIAMYPYNKISQFSKLVKVIVDGEIKEVGGTTGFKVSEKPSLKYLKNNNTFYKTLKKNNYYYFTDENLIHGNKSNDFSNKNLYLIMILGSIIILMFQIKI